MKRVATIGLCIGLFLLACIMPSAASEDLPASESPEYTYIVIPKYDATGVWHIESTSGTIIGPDDPYPPLPDRSGTAYIIQSGNYFTMEVHWE